MLSIPPVFSLISKLIYTFVIHKVYSAWYCKICLQDSANAAQMFVCSSQLPFIQKTKSNNQNYLFPMGQHFQEQKTYLKATKYMAALMLEKGKYLLKSICNWWFKQWCEEEG